MTTAEEPLERQEADPLAIEARDRGLRWKPRSLRGRLTEYLSLATAASFLLAIWVNQLIFDSWGLSFVQLATASDVLMSGIALLGYVLTFVLVVLFCYWVARGRGLLRVLWWLLLLPVVALLALAVASDDPEAKGVLGTSGALLLLALVYPRTTGLRARGGRRRRVVQAASATVFAVAVLAMGWLVIGRHQREGYVDAPLRVLTPGIAGCAGQVLWTGERALVLDCNPDPRVTEIRVAYGQENWIFVREPKRKPGSGGSAE